MESLTIYKTGEPTGGAVYVPSSKSYTHRYLLSALAADGKSEIANVSMSDDIAATVACLRTLGADVEEQAGVLTVRGGLKRLGKAELYCGESASTLRFLIPISLLFAREVTFRGTKSLLSRPMEPYLEVFAKHNIKYELIPGESFKISGELLSGAYDSDGSVSSQFVTGLLYALPLLEGDSVLDIRGTLRSAPYADITLDVLKHSGIEIQNDGYRRFYVKGGQKFAPRKFICCGDYSQAAFFLCLGCISGDVAVYNLSDDTFQGDRVMVDILRKMGGKIKPVTGGLVAGKSRLASIGTIDVSDCPDLFPILSLACALAEGRTVITGIERLRFKESDRINATVSALSSLGADIREDGASVVINGKPRLDGGEAHSFNDHRIAMMLTVAAYACKNKVVINDPMCINKSYPEFYNDIQKLGGAEYECKLG